MRIALYLPATVLALVSGLAQQASAQVFVTSVTASFPDPNGKVPGLNLVPGAGVPNWTMGLAQAVLSQSQYYNYCVSFGSGTASGTVGVQYKLARGSTVIQAETILPAKSFSIGPNGIWYFCSGYYALPSSPGAAKLTGTVTYTPTGGKTIASRLSVPVLLQ